MSRKKTKLIKSIICGIIIFFILSAFLLLFTSKMQNKAVFIFDRSAVLILSSSMEDKIEAISYISIEKVDPKDIKVGDIIMFYSDDPTLHGRFNTHRVIEIIGDNQEFVTMGDNNSKKDDYTAKASKVVGRYTGNLPALTALVRFFLSKIGFAITLVVFILLSAFVCLPDIIKYFSGKTSKKTTVTAEEEERRLIDEEIARLKAQEKNK